ncbi:MAG: dynamin family protein [Propionibacteriaceae bacterium]|jgi:energy-coupling factor transporter ATP-binding protein EcfA2|nr:dynamin family protein [Propionibacteriaceae bacterium]
MAGALESALSRLRAAFQAIRLYLPLPNAVVTQDQVNQALDQLDDYILPRLRQIRAPLLVIVGGSTGAGKSTLVNSIIGHAVSPTGVIRPTTKSPVLIHHPEDSDWFAGDRILPSLARSTGPTQDLHTLRILPDTAMPRGMAVLDAPDIDSIDVDNRTLASQLLAAGDLWLFITSATRYADAVPWDYLQRAVERSAAVAVVLDRVPPAAMTEVPAHLAAMMTESGLGNSPFFAVPETVVDEQGMLPKAAVEPIRSWLAALAADQRTRGLVVMKTLDGSIGALAGQAPRIAEGLSDQLQVVDHLRQGAASAFIDAIEEVADQTRDSLLARDEVLIRWQEHVQNGDLVRSLGSPVARARDRVAHRLRGEPIESDNARQAVESGLEALLVQAGLRACERAEAAWLDDPAGRYIIERTGVHLGQPSADFRGAAGACVRRWQDEILTLASAEGAGRRIQARVAALGLNAIGVSLLLVAFARADQTREPQPGASAGSAAVARRLLELVFGEEPVRRLTTTAKELLDTRIKELMSGQLGRFTTVLESLRLDPSLPRQVLALAEEIDRLRSEELVALSLQAVLTPTEQAAIEEVEGAAARGAAAAGLEQLIESRPPALATGGQQ